MILKSTYKLSYTIDKEPKDLIVTVELKQAEGFNQPRQNLWRGDVIVNDRGYTEDLSHCVNAQAACERIGNKIKETIIAEAKAAGKKIRLGKETLK